MGTVKPSQLSCHRMPDCVSLPVCQMNLCASSALPLPKYRGTSRKALLLLSLSRPMTSPDRTLRRAGVLPFWGGTSDNVSPLMVMQEILGGDIRFDGAPWEGISAEAVDFVNRLLDRDYNTRMTAEQALQHPWIADLFCEAETEHSGA